MSSSGCRGASRRRSTSVAFLAAVLAAVVGAGALAGCTSDGPRGDAASTGGSPGGSDAPASSAPDPDRPNIVLVLTDDLSSDLLPYLPAVQRMQRLGATFTDHFVVNSLCCPSRAAIFTGQYPHNSRVRANEGADGGYAAFHRRRLDRVSFPVSLQRAGYRTAFMGKYLNGYQPDDGQPLGWDDWIGAGDAYFNFNYTLDENGEQKRYGELPEDYLTDVLSGKADRFADDAASDGKPFFLEVSTFAPHDPWTPAPRDATRFPGLRHPRPPSFGRLPTHAPSWMRTRALNRAEVREIDHAYRKRVQAVQAVDDLITNLRSVLSERGVLDNTYFLFTSDNGFHMGEHGLLPGKQTAFDTDIRVPLVVTGPGVRAGSRISAMSSSIDFAPTFESVAGAVAPISRDGVSLLPLLHRGSAPPGWQRVVLIEHQGHRTPAGDPDHQPVRSGYPPSYAALRTDHSVYVEYVTGEREFYDLRTDPYENDNTIGTAPRTELDRDATILHQLTACAGAKQCQAAAGA